MYLPVLVLAALVLGTLVGVWRARARGGKALDMLQYAAAHAIPLMIVALFVTIYLDRTGQ